MTGTPARDPPTWGRALFLVTWGVAAAYAALHLDRGWFPADAGALGHTAERVLLGELPHRDFQDPYTGGLAMLNAVGFRVLGVGVMSMRWVAWAVFLLWVPAFHRLAARLADPVSASLATLLAASWTLPVYAEGMPSWYNLFLATFGALALVRFRERGGRRWLIVAGVASALSILVKIVGLYLVAAVGLFLLFDAAHPGPETDGASGGAAPDDAPDDAPGDVAPGDALAGDAAVGGAAPGPGFRRVGLGACATLAVAVTWLVVRAMGARHFFLYGVPPLAAVVAVAASVASASRTRGGSPLARLGFTVPAYAVGLIVPIAIFVVPYALAGAVPSLVQGVFGRPAGRLDAVGMIGPAGRWWEAWPALLVVAWVWALAHRPGRAGVGILAAGSLAGLALLVASAADPTYVASFRALLWLSPLIAVLGAWALLRPSGDRPAERGVAFLALSLYGLTSLVQIPFAAPTYFFYAAPLALLVALATVPGRGAALRPALVLLLALTVLRFNHGFTLDIGFRYRPDALSATLRVPRADGVRVSPEDKEDYERLVAVLSSVAAVGDAIFAGPDAPEVYFLTGLRNPLPTLYEVLADDGDPDRRVLDAIADAHVSAVVVRPAPLFSPALSNGVVVELERRFPMGTRIGRFIVAWRPPG